MCKITILLVRLCACNAVLGIDNVPQQECENNIDCADNVNNKTCASHFRCVVQYQVTGADVQYGLSRRELPRADSAYRGSLPNGATLDIVCQTSHGAQADGRTLYDDNNQPTDLPFTTWDQLDDGSWVYDWYTNTLKIVQGYSPQIDHCPGE